MSEIIAHADLELLSNQIKELLSKVSNDRVSSIKYKSSNDAVTNLDLMLQKKIMAFINDLEPDVICVSEESNTQVADDFDMEQDCWIIDPLDGTSNFIQGLRPSAISIAKVSGKDVLASMVIDLSNLDVYSAVKGDGWKLNFREIKPSSPKIRLIGMSTGYLRAGGLVPYNWNARVIGSQALQLCLVGMGALGANVSYEAKAWDDVAGSLIVRESGGVYVHEYMNQPWLELALSGRSLRSKATTFSLDDQSVDLILGLKN